MTAGRPSLYTPELIEKAWEYVNGGWQVAGDKVPSVAGMACEIGIHRDTCHSWAGSDGNEFSDILKAIAQKQERELVNNGLDGTFTPTITKMMMTKHGYSDRVEQHHTSPDGSMTPTQVIVQGEPVPNDNSDN